MSLKRLTIAAMLCAGLAVPAFAQNTGGVFPPMVNEGHRSAQYRIAINPDNAAGDTGIAQRAHYQQAINGDLMWRIIGQTVKTDDSDFDFDFVQAELFWELTDEDPEYRSGLRFDARLRDGDRANQIGVNWMNQFYFDNGWSARAVILTSTQVGDNAGDGVNVSTRWQIAKKLEAGQTVGVELYNTLGNTDDWGSLDDYSQTIGPIIAMPIADKWSFFGGVLFGLTDASPDTEARMWFTRSL